MPRLSPPQRTWVRLIEPRLVEFRLSPARVLDVPPRSTNVRDQPPQVPAPLGTRHDDTLLVLGLRRPVNASSVYCRSPIWPGVGHAVLSKSNARRRHRSVLTRDVRVPFICALWSASAHWGSVGAMADDRDIFTSGFSRRGFMTAAGVVGAAALTPLATGTASAATAPAAADTASSAAGDPVTTPRVNGLHLQFGADAVQRGRGLLAHPAAGAPAAGAARRARRPLRAAVPARSGQLHRRQVRPGRLRLPRARSPACAVDTSTSTPPCTTAPKPEFGSFRTGPRGRAAVHLHQLRRPGHADASGKVYVPPAGVTHRQPAVRQRQPRLAGRRRHHGRRRAGAAAVPPVQRRPLLRQPGQRPGADLVGLLGEQHAAAPATGPGCRRPATTRTNSATARSGMPPTRPTSPSRRQPGQTADHPRPLVLLHRRLGAGDQPRQRRRLLPGRRQQLRPRLLRRRAEGVAGERTAAPRGPTATSTGSSSACTRSRSAPPTSSTAPTWASARNGCRCSTSTASTSSSAATSTTTSARTRSAASRPNATLTPIPAATRTDVVDTTKGTVHMVLGGGGTSAPSNQLFFNPPACRVITAVGAPDPTTGKRPPVYVREDAPWSAVRDAAHSYGFAAFSVDPGTRRGGDDHDHGHLLRRHRPARPAHPVRNLHPAAATVRRPPLTPARLPQGWLRFRSSSVHPRTRFMVAA